MKIENVIVCDDVRIEASGKHILIGVYPDDIAVPSFPATIALTVWAQFRIGRTEEVPIEFQIIQEDNKQLVHGRGRVRVANAEAAATIPFPQLAMKLEKATKLVIQFREAEKDWLTIKTVRVKTK